ANVVPQMWYYRDESHHVHSIGEDVMSLEKLRQLAFIIYNDSVQVEADIAYRLRQELPQEGIDVFQPAKSGSIRKQQWEGLQEADIIIALISPQFPQN